MTRLTLRLLSVLALVVASGGCKRGPVGSTDKGAPDAGPSAPVHFGAVVPGGQNTYPRGFYNTTPPSPANGDSVNLQTDSAGNLLVSGTISVNTGGLATSANQSTEITSLANIPAKGTAVMTGSMPVTLATNDTNWVASFYSAATTGAVTTTGVSARMFAFDSSGNVVVLRSGATTVQSTNNNMLDDLPQLVYNTSAPAPANGNTVPFQSTFDGALKVRQELKFANQTTAATTTVKSGAGFLHAVNVNTCVSGATVKIFDNTAGSGTSIGIITCPTNVAAMPTQIYDVAFATGLTMLSSGATDVTESYQ